MYKRQDQTRTILFHPFIEFIRAVLEVVELDFSYESVFRFLRCGLTDITEQQIDLLENYVLAKGIRGRKKWEKQWTFVFDDTEKENLTEMNEVRAKIYDLFAPLSEAFTQGKTCLLYTSDRSGLFSYHFCSFRSRRAEPDRLRRHRYPW